MAEVCRQDTGGTGNPDKKKCRQRWTLVDVDIPDASMQTRDCELVFAPRPPLGKAKKPVPGRTLSYRDTRSERARSRERAQRCGVAAPCAFRRALTLALDGLASCAREQSRRVFRLRRGVLDDPSGAGEVWQTQCDGSGAQRIDGNVRMKCECGASSSTRKYWLSLVADGIMGHSVPGIVRSNAGRFTRYASGPQLLMRSSCGGCGLLLRMAAG
ncbi:hypothetical protein BC628DRAFT_36427 [Trametes gibbosa]|nr:hypothetical protein BC628DRAFT_36427 [Trametes gibbosa]